jgi:hypothetical protein
VTTIAIKVTMMPSMFTPHSWYIVERISRMSVSIRSSRESTPSNRRSIA